MNKAFCYGSAAFCDQKLMCVVLLTTALSFPVVRVVSFFVTKLNPAYIRRCSTRPPPRYGRFA